ENDASNAAAAGTGTGTSTATLVDATGTGTGTSTATTSSTDTCPDTSDQYAVLVSQYDSDGDGKLSDDELAEARQGFADAQTKEMDTNGDGVVSEDEKQAWIKAHQQEHKEKLGPQYEQSCKEMGKQDADCQGMRGNHLGEFKQALDKRFSEFDKNGD